MHADSGCKGCRLLSFASGDWYWHSWEQRKKAEAKNVKRSWRRHRLVTLVKKDPYRRWSMRKN